MARIKKRLQRKQPVKRVVRRKPQQTTKPTPEQKAKDIEMMKAMLIARPKRLMEEARNTEAKRQEKQNIESRIEQEKSERERLTDEINVVKDNYKALLKQAKTKEQAQRLKEDYEEKIDELQRRANELDEKTEEGQTRAEIERIKTETRETLKKIDEAKKAINSNKLYGELKEVQFENEKSKAEHDALQKIIVSRDFQKPSKALIEAYEQKHRTEGKLKHKREILELKEENNRKEAELRGKSNYDSYINTRHLKPALDEKGRPTFAVDENGVPIFTPSIVEQQQAELAMQTQRKLEAERRQRKLEAERRSKELEERIFGQDDLISRVIKGSMEEAAREAELRGMENFVASDNFNNKTAELEKSKAEVTQKAQERQLREESIEQQKRIKSMQAQNEVQKAFSQNEVDQSAVLTQMQTLTDNAISQMSKKQQEDTYKEVHETLYNEYLESFDKLMKRYQFGGFDKEASERFCKLINYKTNNMLPGYADDFNNANLEKLIEFTKMMTNVDRDILLYDEKTDAFMESDLFKKFDWDLSKTMAGDEVM